MSHLPYDCTRCAGVSSDEGELVAPCRNCRRLLWANPSGPRSPWLMTPPRTAHGTCEAHWPTGDAK